MFGIKPSCRTAELPPERIRRLVLPVQVLGRPGDGVGIEVLGAGHICWEDKVFFSVPWEASSLFEDFERL